MTDYRQEQLDKLTALDLDAEREAIRKEHPDESVYPRFCGVLLFWINEAISLATNLKKELTESNRRKNALEWAAETVLKGDTVSTGGGEEAYELLYSAADVIEKAMADGMTDDQLRRFLQSQKWN